VKLWLAIAIAAISQAQPVVDSDHRVTFRILAPRAESVKLAVSDLPGYGQGVAMTRSGDGVWEAAIGPLRPGAYRYYFSVDGVVTVDPRNPSISESAGNVWSLVYVPGVEFMDARDVAHGAIASVTYWSDSLKEFRRMHVYTSPGYESGKGAYPVLYLLHGAGDNDESWASVGRAGFILDNLIAAKKARPMIVVMPAGHTAAHDDALSRDFTADLMPYIESHYRTSAGRAHHAIAGQSMGGSQALSIAIAHPDMFAYVGVFSSGLSDLSIDNAAAVKTPKLLWFSTGVSDAILNRTRSTVEMLRSHGFQPVFHESSGGHTWTNWRNYLNEFAPQLFQ
jgi:enterochelin esterase family protein